MIILLINRPTVNDALATGFSCAESSGSALISATSDGETCDAADLDRLNLGFAAEEFFLIRFFVRP